MGHYYVFIHRNRSNHIRDRRYADLEVGEIIIYPGDFLIGAVTNYDFTPYNTTIRIEDGQVVEMNRVYIP